MIEIMGSSPISSVTSAGRSEFMSLLRNKPSKAFGEDPNRYPRPYTAVRGILINKEYLDAKPVNLDKGYYFQFNPQTIEDVKTTLYETRAYAGLSYNDYIWSNGGERIITFQLFLDNTPQSKTRQFRPMSYNSTLAQEIKTEGTRYAYGNSGQIESVTLTKGGVLNDVFGVSLPQEGPSAFEYDDNGAFSPSRVHERGILPEVELIQSFLYPAPIGDETTPHFSEGGIVSSVQFRPPATVVFAVGPLYLEGVIKSAPVRYTLFDQDLTPIRGTIDIEFAVFEFENITRQIDWKAIK